MRDFPGTVANKAIDHGMFEQALAVTVDRNYATHRDVLPTALNHPPYNGIYPFVNRGDDATQLWLGELGQEYYTLCAIREMKPVPSERSWYLALFMGSSSVKALGVRVEGAFIIDFQTFQETGSYRAYKERLQEEGVKACPSLSRSSFYTMLECLISPNGPVIDAITWLEHQQEWAIDTSSEPGNRFRNPSRLSRGQHPSGQN